MVRPFDVSKIRKKIDKSIAGLSYGFRDPTTFLHTGAYALNYLISGRFDGGIPLEGMMSMFAGSSQSGKSYIVSANLVKDAQSKGIFAVLIDTENALTESWLTALGVDVSEEKLMRIAGASIDDVSKITGEIIDNYRELHGETPYAERPKMLFVIDSVGMMISPNQERQFMEGDQKGDMGIKAKMVTNMVRVLSNKIASQPIGLVVTNHTYDSQDMYSPETIAGGRMLIYASAVIVQMTKLLLKEDENGNRLEGGEVAGTRSSMTIFKSRMGRLGQKIKVDIPYSTGMNPYSGCFDLFEKKGLLVKEGNRYTYTSRVTGEIFKDWRKNLRTAGIYDVIISEQPHWDADSVVGGDVFGITEEPDDE